MRLAWVVLIAGVLAVAGCSTQEPAPPPEGETPDEGDDGTEGGEETPEPGGEPDEDADQDDGEEPPMQIYSPAFADGDEIPIEHTADGEDTSPPLNLTDVPNGTQSLALVVDDPDAPTDDAWVHWLIWNIPPEADTIAEGYPPSGEGKAFEGARQGDNDFGNERYNGPAPPEEDDPHRYRFQLFALDVELHLEQGAQRAELDDAMEGHVIEQTTLSGTYGR